MILDVLIQFTETIILMNF